MRQANLGPCRERGRRRCDMPKCRRKYISSAAIQRGDSALRAQNSCAKYMTIFYTYQCKYLCILAPQPARRERRLSDMAAAIPMKMKNHGYISVNDIIG